jgi:hypothetical protein
MSIGLTDKEWERIEQFARTPGYKRSPEQLIPEDANPE